MSVKDFVKQACDMGLPVFPVGVTSTDKSGIVPHIKQLSQDDEICQSWEDAQRIWDQYPDKNYAVRGGWSEKLQKYIVIVDVDDDVISKKGFDSLQKLETEYGQLPDTFSVGSPSGGLHMYFTCDEELHSSQGLVAQWIDIKGWHGYVVGAGSRREKWKNKCAGNYVIEKDLPLAELPTWLKELCKAPKKQMGNGVELEVQNVPPGERNGYLFKMGAKLRGMGFDAETIELALLKICDQLDPPTSNVDKIPDMVQRIVKSYQPNDDVQYTDPASSLEDLKKIMGDKKPTELQKKAEEIRDRIKFEMPSMEGMQILRQEFLFDNWFPRSAVSLVAGPAGQAKTTVLLSVAAAITRGRSVGPGMGAMAKGRIAIATAEDSIPHAILPRLVAAGADPSLCHFIPGFDIQTHAQALDDTLAESGEFKLLIIDPITAFMERGADMNNNSDARRVGNVYSKLAAKHDLAIVGISHLNKSTTARGTDKVLGAGAWTHLPRATYMIKPDPNDEELSILVCIKTNMVVPELICFTRGEQTVQTDKGPSQELRLKFQYYKGSSSYEDIVNNDNTAAPQVSRKESCQRFLLDLLSTVDDIPMRDVEKAVQDAGFSMSMVQKLKKELGIISLQCPKSKPKIVWLWKLGVDDTSR